MNVKELMEALAEIAPDAKVLAIDSETGKLEEVTGLTYDASSVELFTDDVS